MELKTHCLQMKENKKKKKKISKVGTHANPNVHLR